MIKKKIYTKNIFFHIKTRSKIVVQIKKIY